MLIPALTEQLSEEHPYRQVLKLVNFEPFCEPLKDGRSRIGPGA